MNTLLTEVLVLARSDAGKIKVKWERINLNEMVTTIVEEVTISTSKSHSIEYTPDEGCNEIISDEYLLRTVIVNLLTNAIKYSQQSKSVRLSIQRLSSAVELHVSDTGIGISPEDQEHLFESFFRGKNISTISGTGLGLSIVKRAVNQLNGTIKVQSTPDKGSEFIVLLPLQIEENLAIE
jgi:signal transduction histidine kinase